MGLKSRINQRGAMPSFIIIGVILVIGLASGIYFLKKHGEQVRQDKIIASIEQKQINNSKVSEEKPKTDTTIKSDIQTSDALPKTGIDLDVFQLLGMGLTVMSISSYLSSRRKQISYL